MDVTASVVDPVGSNDEVSVGASVSVVDGVGVGVTAERLSVAVIPWEGFGCGRLRNDGERVVERVSVSDSV